MDTYENLISDNLLCDRTVILDFWWLAPFLLLPVTVEMNPRPTVTTCKLWAFWSGWTYRRVIFFLTLGAIVEVGSTAILQIKQYIGYDVEVVSEYGKHICYKGNVSFFKHFWTLM
ncbi:hypothetical protein GLOTRDRAFT_94641 [Gloeophyllum trabeum ATCC 11539]|uniref:Uncharacterized protein n=1 Tax=Gloeophyllum trabeum (strain ATCC 11539 / FP-39264 / Madison 617) TaxID=670483 RepID=S7RJ02_GLOTA|nr:uncharacterized protein GLOTRDRAFT_94641 [Gloeophyllum trabeum ATCC 11539]EPQ54340.1 hypothetical protein GLOTRDRAFT_94641 [Gloeophyllum trabeum ATCC 11539]